MSPALVDARSRPSPGPGGARPAALPGGLSLVGLELVKVAVPIIEPWSTVSGTLHERESLLVRVVLRAPGPVGAGGASSRDIEGWGECPALPTPGYASEYTDAALAVAERFVVGELVGHGVASAAAVSTQLEALAGNNMLKTAFQMAYLDAELRYAGMPLAAYLAGASAASTAPAIEVTAGVAVGLGDDFMSEVARFVDQGYRRVKLKVLPGRAVSTVEAVRRRWPDLVLMADANGTFASLGPRGAAAELAGLEPYGLACLEQPLAADDLLGHAELARHIKVPICLDESLRSLNQLALALYVGACSVVNIKAGRMGGYLEAVRAHDLCLQAGAQAWCGGMVDLGLGRSANIALASLPGFSLPGDLSASSRFFAEDIAGPIELGPGGALAVPTGPGLGVEVRAGALQRYTRHRAWYPRDGTAL